VERGVGSWGDLQWREGCVSFKRTCCETKIQMMANLGENAHPAKRESGGVSDTVV
jgi:hypothetical protein